MSAAVDAPRIPRRKAFWALCLVPSAEMMVVVAVESKNWLAVVAAVASAVVAFFSGVAAGRDGFFQWVRNSDLPVD